MNKTCACCKESLPLDSFTKMVKARDGKHPYCRSCNSRKSLVWQRANPDRVKVLRARSALKNRNGLTEESYNALLAAQGNGCAICGTNVPGHVVDRRFDVDHDHNTGRIRGLLCQACNMGIGQLNDDPERLRAAARYLEGS